MPLEMRLLDDPNDEPVDGRPRLIGTEGIPETGPDWPLETGPDFLPETGPGWPLETGPDFLPENALD